MQYKARREELHSKECPSPRECFQAKFQCRKLGIDFQLIVQVNKDLRVRNRKIREAFLFSRGHLGLKTQVILPPKPLNDPTFC